MKHPFIIIAALIAFPLLYGAVRWYYITHKSSL